jgi:hypothetical protein
LTSIAPRSLGLNGGLRRDARLPSSATSSVEEDLVWIPKKDSPSFVSAISALLCLFFGTARVATKGLAVLGLGEAEKYVRAADQLRLATEQIKTT